MPKPKRGANTAVFGTMPNRRRLGIGGGNSGEKETRIKNPGARDITNSWVLVLLLSGIAA
jgi:hypothetical protein